jgi:hypothetical protein
LLTKIYEKSSRERFYLGINVLVVAQLSCGGEATGTGIEI